MTYETLQSHLAAGRWQEADELTRTAILTLVDRQNSWLREQDILRLSPADMMLIDRLWRNYSNARFGFSVQAKAWNNLENNSKKTKEYFCKKIAIDWGWELEVYSGGEISGSTYDFKRNGKIPCDLGAPVGHLPSTFALGGGTSTVHSYSPDIDCVMGYCGDYSVEYYHRWSSDSFVGYNFLKSFYPLVKTWYECVS